MEALQRQQAARLAQGVGPLAPPRPLLPPQPPLPDHRTLQAPEGALGVAVAEEEEDAEEDEEGEEAGAEEEAAEESHPGAQGPSSPSSQPPGLHPHEWTYEEQFKQPHANLLPGLSSMDDSLQPVMVTQLQYD
ncbi:AT-rich interactive domain-containing protein 3C [Saguinus oedipus]|uniref:AT-rich interactive domain-containing protein 3C n=1 Tax=Saguinus oedipus TaxID=9490 RepID=A0ABQ9WHY9_SAGOE|nr:AT-rich interactive domain-containing protein 3C [Saguinus oedipus]